MGCQLILFIIIIIIIITINVEIKASSAGAYLRRLPALSAYASAGKLVS